jgi:hypothetical protein
MMKNRSIKALGIVWLCLIMITACGQKNTVEVDMDLFTGKWECEEHPLEHEEYYTGFVTMNIQEDGSFRMVDVEAGNPVISGELEFLSDTKLVLKCSTEDDFDPPPTWQTMEEEQEVEYRFTEDGKLCLTYNDGEAASTLVFVKK